MPRPGGPGGIASPRGQVRTRWSCVGRRTPHDRWRTLAPSRRPNRDVAHRSGRALLSGLPHRRWCLDMCLKLAAIGDPDRGRRYSVLDAAGRLLRSSRSRPRDRCRPRVITLQSREAPDRRLPPRRGGRVDRGARVRPQPACPSPAPVPEEAVGGRRGGSGRADRGPARLSAVRPCRIARRPPAASARRGAGRSHDPAGPAAFPSPRRRSMGTDRGASWTAAVRRVDGATAGPCIGPGLDPGHPAGRRAPRPTARPGLVLGRASRRRRASPRWRRPRCRAAGPACSGRRRRSRLLGRTPLPRMRRRPRGGNPPGGLPGSGSRLTGRHGGEVARDVELTRLCPATRRPDRRFGWRSTDAPPRGGGTGAGGHRRRRSCRADEGGPNPGQRPVRAGVRAPRRRRCRRAAGSGRCCAPG